MRSSATVRDPNRYEYFAGQNKQLNRLGHLYAELGHVRIDRIENGYAVATIEASCQPIVAGDLVIPFRRQRQLHRAAPDYALSGIWRCLCPGGMA